MNIEKVNAKELKQGVPVTGTHSTELPGEDFEKNMCLFVFDGGQVKMELLRQWMAGYLWR